MGEVLGENRMQLIITDAWLARSRAIHLTGTKLVLAALLASVVKKLQRVLLMCIK